MEAETTTHSAVYLYPGEEVLDVLRNIGANLLEAQTVDERRGVADGLFSIAEQLEDIATALSNISVALGDRA